MKVQEYMYISDMIQQILSSNDLKRVHFMTESLKHLIDSLLEASDVFEYKKENIQLTEEQFLALTEDKDLQEACGVLE